MSGRGERGALPVHSELGRNPVETQRHQGHVRDALAGARRQALLHGDLQQAKVHLQGGEEGKKKKMNRPEPTGLCNATVTKRNTQNNNATNIINTPNQQKLF